MNGQRPVPSRRQFASRVLVLLAATSAGCGDYGIKEGDNPQIIALKKAGARVQYGLAGGYYIDLKDTGLDDGDLEPIEQLPDILTLDLSGTDVTDAGLARIAAGPKDLTSLILDNTDVTDEGLAAIAGLSNLTTLSIAGTGVTDAGLALLPQNHSRLKSLTLMDCEKITNEGLKSIARLEALEAVSLANCRQITDEGLEHLMGRRGFRMIYLLNTSATDATAARLARTTGALMVVTAGGELAGMPGR